MKQMKKYMPLTEEIKQTFNMIPDKEENQISNESINFQKI